MEENTVVNEVVDVNTEDSTVEAVSTDSCGSTLVGVAVGAGLFALGVGVIKGVKHIKAKLKAKKEADKDADDTAEVEDLNEWDLGDGSSNEASNE